MWQISILETEQVSVNRRPTMTRAWNWKSWRPTTAVCAAYGYVMEISSSSNTFSPLYARFRVLSCLFPLLPSFLPPSLFCRGPLYFLVPLRSLFRLLNVHIPFPSVPDPIAFFPPASKPIDDFFQPVSTVDRRTFSASPFREFNYHANGLKRHFSVRFNRNVLASKTFLRA